MVHSNGTVKGQPSTSTKSMKAAGESMKIKKSKLKRRKASLIVVKTVGGSLWSLAVIISCTTEGRSWSDFGIANYIEAAGGVDGALACPPSGD